MEKQQTFFLVFALVPLVLGIVWRFAQISIPRPKTLGLATIIILGMVQVFAVETDPPTKFLAFAVLLSVFCSMLCQDESGQARDVYPAGLVAIGLALGALLVQGFLGRLFLCGLLGYVAFSLTRKKFSSFRTTLILVHIIVAIILSLSSILGGDTLELLAGLFLAVTFLPMVPFHFPFVGAVECAKGNLSSSWIVIWLAIGLAELNGIYDSLSSETLLFISLWAVVSAFYASLTALGQKQNNLFIVAATVVHVSLAWGLLNVFPGFSRWGIAYGVAVAFVLGGICLAFSFVRQRYGWKTLGKLPGLASPMPRFGTVMVLLVSFALFLPMFPTFSGLTTLSTVEALDVEFFSIFILFIAVWLGGGWFLLQMLHETAFGTARADVPYTDLRVTEITAVTILLLGAGYSGLLY